MAYLYGSFMVGVGINLFFFFINFKVTRTLNKNKAHFSAQTIKIHKQMGKRMILQVSFCLDLTNLLINILVSDAHNFIGMLCCSFYYCVFSSGVVFRYPRWISVVRSRTTSIHRRSESPHHFAKYPKFPKSFVL